MLFIERVICRMALILFDASDGILGVVDSCWDANALLSQL